MSNYYTLFWFIYNKKEVYSVVNFVIFNLDKANKVAIDNAKIPKIIFISSFVSGVYCLLLTLILLNITLVSTKVVPSDILVTSSPILVLYFLLVNS